MSEISCATLFGKLNTLGYKVIEGAAYILAMQPDAKLDKYLDDLIAKIAAAQEPDGYLYTARRLFPPEKMPVMPVSLIDEPCFSSDMARASSSLGVVNMHLISCPALRMVNAWSMQCCL